MAVLRVYGLSHGEKANAGNTKCPERICIALFLAANGSSSSSLNCPRQSEVIFDAEGDGWSERVGWSPHQHWQA